MSGDGVADLTEEQRRELARIAMKLKAQTALASAIVSVIIYDLYHPNQSPKDIEREAYLRG